MATGTRRSGEFCWINMLTADPEAARAFYAALLGWTYLELPGVGHAVRVGGRDIGGLFDLNGPGTPAGTRAHIGVLVKVESADATGERVVALGGTARPAFDIGDQGRMAVCTDPNGAAFDIWEPRKMQGSDADPLLHGAPGWFETITSDKEAATAFYEALFGWVAEAAPPMPNHEYTNFRRDGALVAGLMELTAEMGALRPHWGVYFTVQDVEEAARRANELGGSISVPPRDIPMVGRFCGIVSPQGVMFYCIQWAEGSERGPAVRAAGGLEQVPG